MIIKGTNSEEITFPSDKILALGAVKKSTYVVAEKMGCVKFNITGQIEYAFFHSFFIIYYYYY